MAAAASPQPPTTLCELRRMFVAGLRNQAISIRQGTAEHEYFIARAELDRPQHPEHGLAHLAELLTYDPGEPEWLELLERYRVVAGGNLEKLLPATSEKRYYATEAIRAFAWARRGDIEQAVNLLTQVVEARSSCEYLEAWGLSWLEPERVLERLAAPIALRFLLVALNRRPEAKHLVAAGLPAARRLAALAERYARAFAPSGPGDMAVMGLLRKAGMFAEALAYARHAVRERPTWGSHVGLGLILRQQGAVGEAVSAFRKAQSLDSSNVTALLEAADTVFEADDFRGARALYEEVLAREPKHVWAYPSALFCRWREASSAPFPDDRFPAELNALVREGNARANGLQAPFREYDRCAPRPRDATADALRQLLAKGGFPADGHVKLTLSDVEGPSNLVAFRVAARARSIPAHIEMIYQHVATPDPRTPVEPIAYTLWRREGDVLLPALDPPPASIADPVARLAAAPFDLLREWADASRLAAELGAGAIPGLLACIGTPPLPPACVSAPDWVMRVDLVVAEVIAHIQDDWDRGQRREALYSLLLGPRDWSTEAAIVALARLAAERPALSCDVHVAFEKLDRARPDRGLVYYEFALLAFWRRLPHLYDHEREALDKRLQSLARGGARDGAT